MPWNSIAPGTLLSVMLLGCVMAVVLSRLAWLLPRHIDPALPATPAILHRRRRWGMLAVSPFFAAACAWAFAPGLAAFSATVFVLVLLTLAWIDAETGLLPDLLTLPLLWLGLLVNLNGAFVPLQQAVLGAAAGYLVLGLVYWAFLLVTGRHGLGQGDMKLLAALGAWLGWAALPWVLLVSASLGLAVAGVLRLRGLMQAGDALSFGPCLAVAGILMLFAAAAGL